MNYDAIVIGAGNGGLATAATFAKKGKKVIVFEKHKRSRRMRYKL